jgi:hypothetical protein
MDVSIPLICERTNDKVDVSWQFSLHPTQRLDHLPWDMKKGGLHRNRPYWTLLSLS